MRDEDAIEAALAVVRQSCAIRPPLRALVVGATRDTHRFARLITALDDRAVVNGSEPYSGRKALDVVKVEPSEVDPFSDEPAESLRDRSEYFATCDHCAGTKKLDCRICGARGRVFCHDCGGSGQGIGKRGPIQCLTCRGTTTVACGSCTKGKLKCGKCQGKGKLRRWLVVRRTLRESIQSVPDYELNDARVDVLDVRSSDGRLSAADVEYIEQLVGHPLPEAPPSTRNSRIIHQRIEACEIVMWSVQLELASKVNEVMFVEGEPRPRAVDIKPLRMWRWWVVLSAVVAAACTFLAWVIFFARDPMYYASSMWYVPYVLSSSTAGFALFLAAVVRSSSRNRRSRKPVVYTIVTVAALMMLASLVAFVASYPSLSQAKAMLAAGDVDAAEREVNALSRRSPDNNDVARLAGDVRQHRLQERLAVVDETLKAGNLVPVLDQIEKIEAEFGQQPELQVARKRWGESLRHAAEKLREGTSAKGSKCGTKEPLCVALLLRGAWQVDRSDISRKALAAEVEQRVAAVVDAGTNTELGFVEAHQELESAIAQLDDLAEVAVDTQSVQVARAAANANLEKLRSGVRILGADVGVARAYYRDLATVGSGAFSLPANAGALRYLAAKDGKVVSGYIVRGERHAGAKLAEDEVQQFAVQLLGSELPASKLSRKGDAVTHRTTKVGRTQVELGFDGNNLVEVRFGASIF